MSATPADRRCPECGYSRQGLPTAGRCPECGFNYDESTVVWRPPRWVIVLVGVSLLVQAANLGIIAYHKLYRPVPAGVILPPGVTPSALVNRNAAYLYGGLAIVLVGAAVYILCELNRKRYLAVNDWGIRVCLGRAPREAPWGSIRAIKQGAFLCDWVLLHDGRNIRINRPMYNPRYAQHFALAQARLAEFQARNGASRQSTPHELRGEVDTGQA